MQDTIASAAAPGSICQPNKVQEDAESGSAKPVKPLKRSSTFGVPRILRKSNANESDERLNVASAKGSFSLLNSATYNLMIVTEEDGYNSGRKYCIQTDAEAERREIVELLTHKYKAAKKSKEAKSRFKKMRERIHRITTSDPFQYFFAMLIMVVCTEFFFTTYFQIIEQACQHRTLERTCCKCSWWRASPTTMAP